MSTANVRGDINQIFQWATKSNVMFSEKIQMKIKTEMKYKTTLSEADMDLGVIMSGDLIYGSQQYI